MGHWSNIVNLPLSAYGNRKIAGRHKINMNAPAASQLHSLYSFDQNKIRDLVGRVPISAPVLVGSAIKQGVQNGETMLIADGTISNQLDLNDDGTAYEFHNDVAGGYSAIYRCVYTGSPTAADEAVLSGNWDGTTGADIYTATDSTMEDGLIHTVGWTRNETNTRIFIDGTNISDSETTVTSNTGAGHAFRYDAVQGGGGRWELFTASSGNTGDVWIAGGAYKTSPDARDRWIGGISIVNFYQTDLSESLMLHLTKGNNLLQYLEPEIPQMYFVPDAPVGGPAKAVFGHHQIHNIGI